MRQTRWYLGRIYGRSGFLPPEAEGEVVGCARSIDDLEYARCLSGEYDSRKRW